ncbi:unnamed protein product [Acanthoscelides obtectus]|uniref:Peptidase S1 domain-containing protein n=1 Tax=Acanthoscelides obtectus TaxID=200917 RepID=A0A9P0L7F5_ACAOB|nr:unnamed protein product [Acanthoscelides obtectus]CAK1673339.1 Serine protease SP24D [Acanthoscelides obtectus]
MLKITEDDVNTVQVAEINCHDFDAEKLVYDSAVLELESPIPEGKWKPVKIAKEFTPSEGQKGTIIGWGRIFHGGPISRMLQKIEVEVYDDETCGKKFSNEHHICLGAPPLGGACNGDSGTALIVDGVQVGIASFITNLCGTSNKRYPNVYSRVSSYYDWIHSVAENLQATY